MLKKTVFAIVAIFAMTMLLVPARAWVYPNNTQDNKYEKYGPHAAQMLIHFYATDALEFAAMGGGLLDITDWPLSKSSVSVVNVTGVNLVDYGPEYGIYLLDINENNETKLGNPYWNPPGTTPDNPIVKTYGTCWTADVWLRRAIDYLIDRDAIVADPSIGAIFGHTMYTGIAIPNIKYIFNVYGNTSIPWAWEYSIALANATLDAHGYTIGPVSHLREYKGRVVHLIVYVRKDDVGRNWLGMWLQDKMTKAGFDTTGFIYTTSDVAYEKVMAEEDYHIYTAGWSLGVDPDLSLWWYYLYWWPGDTCYDYDAINDPQLNYWANALYTANTQADAVHAALMGQWYMALNAHALPVYCKRGLKAVHQWNTGNNAFDTTEKQNWLGIVNSPGYGPDNGYSYLNMHTNLTACSNATAGAGMTIDYGFKAYPKKLNPIYSTWLFDWNFMGNCFDSLLARNATDKTWQNWMTTSFSVGLYTHPVYGSCTKITMTLKPGLLWSDGEPLTLADIRFSVDPVWSQGCTQLLLSAGYGPPYWYGSILDILSFTQIDPLTFEVLDDVKSYWALSWIGGAMILPEHIWKPMILQNLKTPGSPDLRAKMPDPNLIGNGPWMFSYWDTVSETGLLVRNPYYQKANCPVDVSIQTNANWFNKFIPAAGLNPVPVTLTNLYIRGPTTVQNFTLWVTYPNGTTLKVINAWTGVMAAGGVQVFNIPWTWKYGLYKFVYELESKTSDGQSYSQTVSGLIVYVTIPEDIVGSTYFADIGMLSTDIEWAYRFEIPTPNIFVDTKDLAACAGAFGGYPGASKWNSVCDLDHNYIIDTKDLAAVARKFGWLPP
jgi:ABC-type transport system substrate-binding protein